MEHIHSESKIQKQFNRLKTQLPHLDNFENKTMYPVRNKMIYTLHKTRDVEIGEKYMIIEKLGSIEYYLWNILHIKLLSPLLKHLLIAEKKRRHVQKRNLPNWLVRAS